MVAEPRGSGLITVGNEVRADAVVLAVEAYASSMGTFTTTVVLYPLVSGGGQAEDGVSIFRERRPVTSGGSQPNPDGCMHPTRATSAP
jgi:hypothetical protein